MNMLLTMALLAAAPPAASESARHPAWLTGNWGDVSSGRGRNVDCGDHTIVHYAGGYYELIDQMGTWEYRNGSICTRTLIEDDGTNPSYRPGALTCQRVKRTARGVAMEWNGRWTNMERCGAVGKPDARTMRLVDRAERRRVGSRRR